MASQFEKAEATFFNFEFPRNYFHLRRALLEPPEGLFSEAELHARLVEAMGAMPTEVVAELRDAWKESRGVFRAKFLELVLGNRALFGLAPVILYRAIGDLLPKGLAEGAAVWGLCQIAAQQNGASLTRAGFGADPFEAADALIDAILENGSGTVFSVDEWEESFARVHTSNRRIQLAVPELFGELDGLAAEPEPSADAAFPFVLSAGERRSFTANTIFRNPDWRKKDRAGALRMHPDDAGRLGVADGGRVRVSTKRGSAEALVEISDRMQPGHVSLPNGLGVDFPTEAGILDKTGVAPNELTASEDRDWVAGTPWHKNVPARIEAMGT
ncbi:MAG: molybdopterin dinucleotide binding domain-containing protein [Candidatus Binatia bacterium]